MALSVASLVGSVLVFTHTYVNNKYNESAWPGAAIVFQNGFILMGTFVMRVGTIAAASTYWSCELWCRTALRRMDLYCVQLIGRQWDGGECRFWEVLLFIWQWNCCCERGMMCMPSLLHRSASHYVVYERADCFRQAVNSDSRAGDSDSASRSIQNWSCLVYLYCVSTFSIERTLAKHTYFHRLSASRKLGKFDTGCRGVKPHLQERC